MFCYKKHVIICTLNKRYTLMLLIVQLIVQIEFKTMFWNAAWWITQGILINYMFLCKFEWSMCMSYNEPFAVRNATRKFHKITKFMIAARRPNVKTNIFCEHHLMCSYEWSSLACSRPASSSLSSSPLLLTAIVSWTFFHRIG